MMGLRSPGPWRFQPQADGYFIYATISDGAVREFLDIVDRISSQGDRWEMLEHFKSHFGASSRSSNEDWAQSDLIGAMEQRPERSTLHRGRQCMRCAKEPARRLVRARCRLPEHCAGSAQRWIRDSSAGSDCARPNHGKGLMSKAGASLHCPSWVWSTHGCASDRQRLG
jgi:hypothetical protein